MRTDQDNSLVDNRVWLKACSTVCHGSPDGGFVQLNTAAPETLYSFSPVVRGRVSDDPDRHLSHVDRLAKHGLRPACAGCNNAEQSEQSPVIPCAAPVQLVSLWNILAKLTPLFRPAQPFQNRFMHSSFDFTASGMSFSYYDPIILNHNTDTAVREAYTFVIWQKSYRTRRVG